MSPQEPPDPAAPPHSAASPGGQPKSLRTLLAAHPVMTWFSVACMLVGAVLGLLELPQEWSVGHRLAGGVLGGAWGALMVVFSRAMGAWR